MSNFGFEAADFAGVDWSGIELGGDWETGGNSDAWGDMFGAVDQGDFNAGTVGSGYSALDLDYQGMQDATGQTSNLIEAAGHEKAAEYGKGVPIGTPSAIAHLIGKIVGSAQSPFNEYYDALTSDADPFAGVGTAEGFTGSGLDVPYTGGRGYWQDATGTPHYYNNMGGTSGAFNGGTGGVGGAGGAGGATDQSATATAITQNFQNHLSPEEIDMFQQLEDNMYSDMMFDVEKDFQELFADKIAEMADRGVLQGDLGKEAMAKIASEWKKTAANAHTNISTAILQQKLKYMLDNRQMSLEEYKVETAKLLSEQGLDLEQQGLDLQKYGIDVGASQAWQALEQSAESSKWGALGGVVGTAAGIIGSKWLLG